MQTVPQIIQVGKMLNCINQNDKQFSHSSCYYGELHYNSIAWLVDL